MGISKNAGGRAAARLPAAALRAVHDLFVAGEVDTSYPRCGRWWPKAGSAAWPRASIRIAGERRPPRWRRAWPGCGPPIRWRRRFP